ncbi:MAG: aspartate kinase [Flavobacteriales bacterium]|nr:aspartate kinase [Flavobacteriales bacterium]
MKVFKFGGASVKNAEAVKNVGKVIQLFNDDLVVVISAMDKTTNALEKVVESYMKKDGECFKWLDEVKNFHYKIIDELFNDKTHQIYEDIHNAFVEIEWELEEEPLRSYDYVYDQIVSVGEIVSTKIVSAYLNLTGLPAQWIDVRNVIQTDNTHRDAKVDWELTEKLAKKEFELNASSSVKTVFLTQGFIGSSSENFTTTLGREGSDFSAGILAYCLNAESVTIWKDVPGMLNADPKLFSETKMLSNISYHEAVELAYYGATVIHPKTIKPLQNKNIPLYVKSFLNPQQEGTVIDNNTTHDSSIPSFIVKRNQVLISIESKDYSFIIENNLSQIFGIFSKMGVKINLMQNSAISFSVVVDFDVQKTPLLIQELTKDYKVRYNENLSLITVRHYTKEAIDSVVQNQKILLEQKSRKMIRMVV